MRGFLLDEHVLVALQAAILRLEPGIQVLRVGGPSAPPLSTSDPELLEWIEGQDLLLVTNNRSTMPVHLAAHLGKGRHVPGIVQLPRHIHLPSLVEDLILIWGAGFSEELRDQILYLPL